jgi:hypothetical protein
MNGAEGHRCNSIIRGLLYSKYIRVASYFSVGQFRQDGASPQFLRFLFACGLTAVLLVGGLGVENGQNGPEVVLILLHAISVCAVGSKWEGPPNKTKNP